MAQELDQIAKDALKSVQEVIYSYDNCARVFSEVREHFKGYWLQISPKIEFAVWANIRFKGDWQAFSEYVKVAVDQYPAAKSDPKNKSQMWAWLDAPYLSEPESGVNRLLDSIDIGLHYCAKELEMDLPAQSVLCNGYQEREHLERVYQFCLALNDVLNKDEH